MTTDPSSEHDKVLERVVCGELSRDSLEVQELAASCPSFAEALTELEELGRQLDHSAAEEQALVEEAIRTQSPQDSAAVVAGLERAWGEGGGPAKSWRPFQRILLAAASFVILFGGWSLWQKATERGGEPGLQQWLGEHDDALARPVGYVEGREKENAFAEFAWDVSTTPGDTFTLRVWNNDEVDPVIVIERLRAATWRPTPEELQKLSTRIRWQVDQFEIAGGMIRSMAARAAVSEP